MGTYVDKVPTEPFEWGDNHFEGLGSDTAKDLTVQKFEESMANAESLLTRMYGADGTGGILGAMETMLGVLVRPAIGDFTVTVPDLALTVASRPAPEIGALDTDFPTFDKTAPSLLAIPQIDTSLLTTGEIPDDLAQVLTWTAQVNTSDFFAALVARILSDLQSGATGHSPAVEQAIYDRDLLRQDIIEEEEERDTLDFFSARGFPLPTGAQQNAIAELANKRARRRTDVSLKIVEVQADLIQKNSQFIIGVAKDLEAILRTDWGKDNDRSLEFRKAAAGLAVSVYAENIKKFLAEEERKKNHVMLQAEHLRGVVDYNKGLVDSFKAEGDAFSVVIDSKAKKNEAVVEIFRAENQGYESQTRADSENQKTQLGRFELLIRNGEMQLKKAIAEVEAAISAYGTEAQFKERIMTAMAQITSQSIASAWGAVHASVSIGHSTGRSETESFGHTESRSVGFDVNNSLQESHPFKEV